MVPFSEKELTVSQSVFFFRQDLLGNTAEGWSRDVTVDIADELRRRYAEFVEVPDSILDFMEGNRR